MAKSRTAGPARKLSAAEDLGAVFARARDGDESALPALRREFDTKPSHYEQFGDAARMAETTLIMRAAGKDVVLQELMRRRSAKVRDELAGPSPSPIERLLAERAALCWLDANTADALYASDPGPSFKSAEYRLRVRDRANARFLAAVKTLAQVRKLNLPTVQINVGQNQLNVAGGGEPADVS